MSTTTLYPFTAFITSLSAILRPCGCKAYRVLAMPTYERSQFGCWTCRVRKKKCDEIYPSCSSCHTRGIVCYGYGPKPDWMDGGEKEKKVVEELKWAIKERQKQKRLSNTRISPQHVALFSFQDNAVDTQPGPPPALYASPVPAGLSDVQVNHRDPESTGSSRTPSPPYSRCGDAKEAETTLLMNYLDHVFPVQFNCYTPPVTELGRGWLLALLTRTKPLYHAALALSAFYMHSILLKTGRLICQQRQWEEMKKHHSLAFKELQVQIAGLNDCPSLKSTIETLACIIQMISFELLRGGTDSWQIHLSAAASLIPTLLKHLSKRTSDQISQDLPTPPFLHDDLSLAEPTSGHISTSRYSMMDDPKPDNNDVACDFLIGTFIWFDFLSCASTHAIPSLPNNESYLSIHKIRLEKIMGCENWAMILISRISALSAWKSSQQSLGQLSMKELISRGSFIEQELNAGLEKNKVNIGKPIHYPESPACQRLGVPSSKSNLVITRVFANAALIYLHTVISGAHPALPEIKESVANGIEAFRMLPSPTLLRNLVWPFCVTGCLAGKECQDFFILEMKIAERGGEWCPGNLWKGWEVVQECWRLREELGDGEMAKGVDWADAMKQLGFQILLV